MVEVYGRSAIQRRKTGVRLLCLEALMSRHLELQAVAVLLKEVWQVPCKMHWQSESRRLAAVMMRKTTMTIGKLSLALATVIVSLFVDIWLSGGFMNFCNYGETLHSEYGFLSTMVHESVKSFCFKASIQ